MPYLNNYSYKNVKYDRSVYKAFYANFKSAYWDNIKKDLQNGVSKIRVGIKPSGRIIDREGKKIFSSESIENQS